MTDDDQTAENTDKQTDNSDAAGAVGPVSVARSLLEGWLAWLDNEGYPPSTTGPAVIRENWIRASLVVGGVITVILGTNAMFSSLIQSADDPSRWTIARVGAIAVVVGGFLVTWRRVGEAIGLPYPGSPSLLPGPLWPAVTAVWYPIAFIIGNFVLFTGAMTILGYPPQIITEPRRTPTTPVFVIGIEFAILVPIEELLYRGYLQRIFTARFSAYPAIIAAAAIFTASHIPRLVEAGLGPIQIVGGLTSIAVIGLAAGDAYSNTRSLLAATTVHLILNFSIVGVRFLG